MLKILTTNRLFFIIFFIWVVLGSILQVLFSPSELLFWINQRHNPSLDTFFRYITLFGEDVVWLGVLLYLVLEKFTKVVRTQQDIKIWLMIWLSKVLLSVSLKNIFNLPRPIEVYRYSSKAIHLIEGVKIHHWQSFPSGHTMTAFAFASASLFILKKAQLSLTFLLGAMLVGYSRMYLFQHFPRDVFAGSIFGIGVVLLLTPFFMNILKEK